MSNSFSKKALFLQVRDALAENIFNGTWKPTAAIGNEIDLAKQYGVSVGTMRRALGQLEVEGLVHRHQGRGTFVSDPASDGLRERFDRVFSKDGRKAAPDVRQLGCETHAASADQRDNLSLAEQDEVVTYRQVVRLNHKPAIYREAHFARKLLPEVDTAATWDIFTAARKNGFWIANGVEKLSLKRVEPKAAAALGLEASATILVLDRVLFALDGKPLEWLVSWCEFTGMYYGVSLT